MKYLLGIDDTDDINGPGTGHLLQALCENIEQSGWGASSFISRHQLFVNNAIPYTSHNSTMCCEVNFSGPYGKILIDYCGKFLEDNSAKGSDPGLCLVPVQTLEQRNSLIDFGRKAKKTVLEKKQAFDLAERLGVHLSEHGGTGQGVIGALAGTGLRLSQNDGRIRGWYHIGRKGVLFKVQELTDYPFIESVRTESGQCLSPNATVAIGGDELKLVFQAGGQVLLVKDEGNGWRTLTKQEIKRY